jgi:SnoaL-like domain
MPDFNDLVSEYIAAWNQTDAAARRALVGEIWAADGRYIDPLADVCGPDQLDAVIGAVQQQFPGMRFRLAGPVDAHHDQARFTWELVADGAGAVVVGFDVAQRDEDGRLALVLGFLDQVPA